MKDSDLDDLAPEIQEAEKAPEAVVGEPPASTSFEVEEHDTSKDSFSGSVEDAEVINFGTIPEPEPISSPSYLHGMTNNRVVEQVLGLSCISYARIGDNRKIKDLRNVRRDYQYQRPIVAEGLVCPPVLYLDNRVRKLILPVPTKEETGIIEVMQRSRNLDVSEESLFMTANKLVVRFRNDPSVDCVYITPGKSFPNGVVAFRINIDWNAIAHDNTRHTNFRSLNIEDWNDEILLRVSLRRQKNMPEGIIHMNHLPEWLFSSKHPEIVRFKEQYKFGSIPDHMVEKVPVEKVAKDLAKVIKQDIKEQGELVDALSLLDGPEAQEEWADAKKRLEKLELTLQLLTAASVKELEKTFHEASIEEPSLFGTDVNAIGAPVQDIEMRHSDPRDLTPEFRDKIGARGADYLNLEASWEGKFNSPTLSLEGEFFPLEDLTTSDVLPTPGFDVTIEGCSPLLTSMMSIGNGALLHGDVDLSVFRFQGTANSATRSPIPFEGSQYATLTGNHVENHTWTEIVESYISTHLVLYTIRDGNFRPGLKKLCDDINALIIYEVLYRRLDCSRIKRIQRASRDILKKDKTLFPGLTQFPKKKLAPDYSEMSSVGPEDSLEVLKCSGEFPDHDLNLLNHLPDGAVAIAKCPDQNIAISGANHLVVTGTADCKVIVRTKGGVGSFDLPYRQKLADDIVVDVTLSPKDAWERICSLGKSGLPSTEEILDVSSEAEEDLEDELSSLVGKVRSVRFSSSVKLKKKKRQTQSETEAEGYVRRNKYYGGYGSRPGLVWEGEWRFCPSPQRNAYAADMRKAAFLAGEVYKHRVPLDEDSNMSQGIPWVLIRDAAVNYDSSLPNERKTHSYSRSMPWSQGRRAIKHIKTKDLLNGIRESLDPP